MNIGPGEQSAAPRGRTLWPEAARHERRLEKILALPDEDPHRGRARDRPRAWRRAVTSTGTTGNNAAGLPPIRFARGSVHRKSSPAVAFAIAYSLLLELGVASRSWGASNPQVPTRSRNLPCTCALHGGPSSGTGQDAHVMRQDVALI